MPEKTTWGIHAGKTGDAESLFLQRYVVAIGWHLVGDLSKLPKNREHFKKALMEAYPNMKVGAIPTSAGQLFRFVHEMHVGDYVLFPSKLDRHIHIGEVTGPYKFEPTPAPGYPNHRPVKWLGKFPRTKFSQGALYELGSALSFFMVKSYAEDFLAALEGKEPAPTTGDDETIAVVAEEIEQNTRDFIIKTIGRELKGHSFSHLVAHLMNLMGYNTRVSPPGPDGGVDIIAHRDELGFEPPIIKVQVKSNEGSIGGPAISQLYGNIESSEHGLFVTLGTFTNQAINFARGKSNLRLLDGDDVVKLIYRYYNRLDSKWKGILPLKMVYVPEIVEEE